MKRTYEEQYNAYLEGAKEGFERLGLMSSNSWGKDPKHLLFYLARYKFVSKMFDGFESVLEVGCGDGFASRIVHQAVQKLTLTDIDPIFIEDIKNRSVSKKSPWIPKTIIHDFFTGPIQEQIFDGIYLLDVLEHIPPAMDDVFLENIIKNLSKEGAMIVGVPTLESQKYASEDSKIGHINLMSQKDLKQKMKKYFSNVFMFSMNDEVVHTGFYAMAHYTFALCSSKRN
ncbi:class I SAM-dependent methyltransferase [Alphaproteobacteria bacterium]|nr:class I SAM-dependent methyltransferase [Alphaproteobacteria bacterium]